MIVLIIIALLIVFGGIVVFFETYFSNSHSKHGLRSEYGYEDRKHDADYVCLACISIICFENCVNRPKH
ncbi:hypothetical protein H839_07409 [Parageobacillus genomosp. 1]|uniref:Uncharacterized protein n=1 Tax=Parageobacillus genomosp. 1 TaxID=1295642 RepID=A0ABC9VFW0_9BACL|nr:hypothetical protein H839_07409 [Parageobacillus genomosp. 1]